MAVVRETLGLEVRPPAALATRPAASRRRLSRPTAKPPRTGQALLATPPLLHARSVKVSVIGAPTAVARSPEITEEDDHVYSQADRDVVPPTLRSVPPMNPARAAVASDAAAIEVLVAKDGTVERVQLLGATHLPDMMVLSSVKTWLFEPATRLRRAGPLPPAPDALTLSVTRRASRSTSITRR